MLDWVYDTRCAIKNPLLKAVVEVEADVAGALHMGVEGCWVFDVEVAAKIPADKDIHLKAHGDFIAEVELAARHGIAEIGL